ncbi:MAG: hypothetical protein WC554_17150 [Clostridia bacterium]
MKTPTFIISIILETLFTSLIVYITSKFKDMQTLDYFILTIGIILIAGTILYYLIGLKIQNHESRIIKSNRTIEIILTKLNITKEVNQRIITAKSDIELLGMPTTNKKIIKQRKGETPEN